ncbi:MULTISPECIES: acyl carrier protein [Citrobacter]|jgi:acyl carrier protein|uniref:Acyl carrier protein n=1 Tax=Citrobacter amalonaticus TaxID=35703 RepID=A0A8I0SV91_CITAM|nr:MULTISPECIES: acyl carrier protein [Citrobacter]HAT6803991.1 acyl carrier protein [Citrobacter freundii]AMG92095.1 acyl carrier protein [Citrobacter amalonaticus]AUO67186.1 acyl carrier protein [Citrobacter freundii complex sp. CFNIH2]EKW2928321.1 acyl carrier protein [Citrobacter amalonaticus]ELK6624581.1 acyl carrier protein [Citrobacter amalonaticus]
MSQHEMIYNKISEMICDAKDLAPEALTPETTLPELELDSLDYVELMVLAKREFNVTLNPEMFMKNPTMTLRELSQRIAQEMAG